METHTSAIAYKLNKYLKFITKTAKSRAKSLGFTFLEIKCRYKVFILLLRPVQFNVQCPKMKWKLIEKLLRNYLIYLIWF